ncbi:MAG TPA: riboflavin synthase [Candidatus Latescibacteria bacterium]|nr:riboflavin synthase [Candidatus Latescibacterota bacterium]
MFTGIVECMGTVLEVRETRGVRRLRIGTPWPSGWVKVGDSISVDGACLTVVDAGKGYISAEVVRETISRTTLGKLRRGDRVNLERPLRLGEGLGGHIVLGHVDGVGRIAGRVDRQGGAIFEIFLEPDLMKYVAPRGSVAVDGVSLTVLDVRGDVFSVSIIPHTLSVTTFRFKRRGDLVNVEVDVLARYLERLTSGRPVTFKKLREMGFEVP